MAILIYNMMDLNHPCTSCSYLEGGNHSKEEPIPETIYSMSVITPLSSSSPASTIGIKDFIHGISILIIIIDSIGSLTVFFM